jgi:hypothetical protein
MKDRFLLFIFCCFSTALIAQQNVVQLDSFYVYRKDTTITEKLTPVPLYVSDISGYYGPSDTITSVSLLPPCPYTIANAKNLVKEGKVQIVIRGGFQGFPEENKKRSEAFRKKYDVSFDYVGCCIFYNPAGEDISGYNTIMKDYLRKKYGEKCITEYKAIFN